MFNFNKCKISRKLGSKIKIALRIHFNTREKCKNKHKKSIKIFTSEKILLSQLNFLFPCSLVPYRQGAQHMLVLNLKIIIKLIS